MKTVLLGIRGFGESYRAAFGGRKESPVSFVGFVDPSPERSTFLGKIRAAGLPIHSSLEEFYARDGADLAIVSSPIPFHGSQTVCALEHGSHVLCEKPLCGIEAAISQTLCMATAQESGWPVADIPRNLVREIAIEHEH